MNYESNHRYYANGSGSNFTFTYNDSIDQAGVPPSRAADPYAEEYPNFTQGEIYQNYQGSYGEPYVDYHARNENHNGLSSTDVHSGIHSQQHTFERPRSRAYSNRSNRNTGRRDHPTIQPERIPVPSSTYLSLAQQPSVHLTDPTQTRKLLILDLNGTLLYREPRARDGRDPYAFTEPRPLRVTHPRPYIPSFKAFLFHPNTRKWLDTMVWSSAQYPNVKDMVSRCFGEEQVKHYAEQVEAAQGLAEETISQKEGLVAIWDRKFLGLSEAQYRNKFQTTKNLAKPWALLPLSTFSGPTQLLSEAWDHVAEDDADLESASGLSSESGLNNTSFLVSLIREGHVPRNDLLAHSALSTLLLDDSPLKARMQPYNHICVPEYEGKFYARDVRIAEADKRLDAISNNHDFPISKGVAAEASPSRDASLGKRKRSRSASPQASPRFRKKHKRFITKPDTKSHHDHILLAVIGLLDALKHESNVAAWIQSEQLFAANCTEDIDLNVLGDEAKRVVEGTDVELDDLYLNSVPEGVEGVAGSTKKIKKERWRNRLRRFGRDNGVSMMSFGSEQSWADSNISFPESVDSENGDDIGVTSNALDKDYEIPPNLSQLTEPASRPITPDVKNASNYSGVTTLPPSPPSANVRRELERKRHLLPRQERRGVPRPSRQSLPSTRSTPNFVDSVYLYGKDADVSDESKVESNTSPEIIEHAPHLLESYSGEKDIFSSPRASPPGLTGKGFVVDLSGGPMHDSTIEPHIIESAIAQTSKSELLPSLWYQHPPARWYWVCRGVRALNELGLEVISGIETDLD